MKKLNNLNSFYNFLLFFLIFVGVLGIADTILLIPVTSSLTLGMMFPSVFGAFLIVFAVINLKKKKPIFKNKAIPRIMAAAAAVAAIFFFTIEAFIWTEAHSDEAADTEQNFVIVLGCGIFPDGTLTLALINRLDAAYDYMTRYPDSVCVVSGGQGSNEPVAEGDAMAEYLIKKGIDESRIIRETEATSTRQNLLFSLELIEEAYPDTEKSVAIVSSEFHMFRVKFLAERYGMDAIGIPSQTSWYVRPNCYIREFFAVVKSYLLD